MPTREQISKANKGIKSIVAAYDRDYTRISEESRRDYISTLKPGAAVPAAGKIYTDKARERIADIAEGYRTKAAGILDGILQDLKDELTAAPSSEAVNTITLLNMRPHVTTEEINDLLDRYGDNPQAHKAIVSIATDRHVLDPFTDFTHPAERMNARVADLRASVMNYIEPGKSGSDANTIAGGRAFMEMNIDQALPTD